MARCAPPAHPNARRSVRMVRPVLRRARAGGRSWGPLTSNCRARPGVPRGVREAG
jgi:hypothetical protein